MSNFLNDLREVANSQNSVNLEERAELLYNGQILATINTIKQNLTTQVKTRDTNTSASGATFSGNVPFVFPNNKAPLPQMFTPKEYSYYKVSQYRDHEYGNHEECFITLNDLFEIKVNSTLLGSYISWIELTPLGERYYADLQKACKQEGITIKGLSATLSFYAKYDHLPDVTLKINERYKCKLACRKCFVKLDYSITL